MKLMLDNRGSFGHIAYPGAASGTFPADSLGLEYPIGTPIEHLFGGGVWVGALIDTSASGQGQRIKAVSWGYEGYGGGINPLFKMYPGPTQSDSIWRIGGKKAPKPPNWDSYWGSLPYKPISDNDFYCQYNDFDVVQPGTVPIGIKVIQSSYAWDDPYADAIIIIQYRIINTTPKSIDSAYVGFFVDADVGPYRITNYQTHNFTGYYKDSRTAYIHNPVDRGSTPVGVALLSTSKSLDSLRYSFNWYPLAQSPLSDAEKYDVMASNSIRSDEYPSLSDTRFLFGFGPFFIKPATDPQPDTLLIAVAIVSGKDLTTMQRNASRALDIYLNQGIRLPATPPSPPLRATVGFRRVELNWKWRPGDDAVYGRPDPETNWDTTNQVARRDPRRYQSPPAPPSGIDSTKGGRNFESYRLWRSENPNYPSESFTLLKQFDVPADSFEYNTGLEYSFVDSNLVRGKTYVYSVTSVSIPNLAYQQVRIDTTTVITVEIPVDPLESSKQTNAVRVDLPFAVSTEKGKVSVVPNPYRTDRNYRLESGGYEGLTSNWDENRRLIKFINLPARCTIRIFSLSGDLVRTVEHDGTQETFPRGDHDVPLLSESNRALASGIYIFTVESQLGVQTGKFVIIR